jgi:cell division protein FtsB
MRFLPALPTKYKGAIGVGFLLLVLCAAFAVCGSGGVLDLRRLQRQQAEAEAMVFRLEQRNRELRDHLERIETDDAYLEKLAREKLGWIKPGELVYRVPRRETE